MTPHRMAERGIEVHVLPADGHARRRARGRARRGLLLQRSRRPGDRRRRGRRCSAECSSAASPTSASASATSCSAARSASAPTSSTTATAASTSRSWTARPARSRSRRTTTASPSTRRSTRTTETAYGSAEVSHVCLNDDVVEGLSWSDHDGRLRAFSVQYHPEAAAGPHDAGYLFDRFVDLMRSTSSTAQGAR